MQPAHNTIRTRIGWRVFIVGTGTSRLVSARIIDLLRWLLGKLVLRIIPIRPKHGPGRRIRIGQEKCVVGGLLVKAPR